MIKKELFFGSWGPEVRELQIGLRKLAYGDFNATGFFGIKTQKAVSNFQKDNYIEPSYGYFGELTRPIFYSKLNEVGRERLWKVATSFIGKDASPNDLAPDEYGCAETISNILIASGLDFPVCLSTKVLYQEFLESPEVFIPTSEPRNGDIIISPTGSGNGSIPNGHVGIFDKGVSIMSNSSASGTFERNYTLNSWKERFMRVGGFPVLFFRIR